MLPILSRTIGGEFMDWQFYLLFSPLSFFTASASAAF